MKRNSVRLEFPNEHCREQVLARVLLHVIEAARPVNLALDAGSCRERLLNKMPDCAGLVFLDLLHCYVSG